MAHTLTGSLISLLVWGSWGSAQAATAPPPTPVAGTTAANQLTRGFTAPSKPVAITQVNALTVAPPRSMAGYSDASFPHWRDASTWGWPVAPSNACDARNAALFRDGTKVTISKTCTVTGGSWTDPYTAQKFASKTQIDIDHIVPRANAWRSGANTWSQTRRIKFANEPLVLASVSASANRAKGDKAPDAWKPPNKASWCLYAKRWTAIKTSYQLSVTTTEKAALLTMLGTCTK